MKVTNIFFLLRLVMITAAVTISACSDKNNDPSMPGTDFSVQLSPNQEVPALYISGASGIANLLIDTNTGAVSGSVTVSGLTGRTTAAHIHAGFAGANGGVISPLEESANNSLVWLVPQGTTFDAPALASLSNGELYINVHTIANAGGEIRGQIIPEGVRIIRTELTGAEEVPAVLTTASALATLTVNENSRKIWSTIHTKDFFENNDATMAHIHTGAFGQNGGVLVGLERDTADTSVWRTANETTLTVEGIESLNSDELYYNVHTPVVPSGEVRGQIRMAQPNE